jgi:aerobic carbon-monoxide dehydrogenase large subunit
MRTVNSFIGSPIERREDLRFLRGAGQYVDDVNRKGQLYAAFLRSSVAHGRIRSVDVAAARALRGVHAIITATDIGPRVPTIPLRMMITEGIERYWQPMIAHSKVRFVGEPIAVAIAESPALAEDALEEILVDIEPLRVVADAERSRKDRTLLFEEAGTNLSRKYDANRGDAETAFRNAPYTRKEKFRVQRHTALPMEMRGLLAEWDFERGRMTVLGAAKVPFFNRRVLAGALNLSEDRIDLIENDVGGGFGARGEFYPEDFLVPFAARLLGRPVKWTEDRREHLTAMNHARDMELDIEIACNRDGTILGLRGQVYIDNGAYVRTNGMAPPSNVVQAMSGPYRIPNIHLEAYVQMTNKTPCGTYRGPGRFEGSFACERLLDMIADDLRIDKLEMRRRNLVSKAEMPYPLAAVMPSHSYGYSECDSGDYGSTLDRCLEEFKWIEKEHLQGKLIDGRYHGLAVGCFIEGGAGGPSENARLVLESDGSVSVYVGSAALGQGLETIFTQIAADALEVPMEAIRGVYHGSTTLVCDGHGSFHSRSTVMGGSAILVAAEKLKDAIRKVAAKRLQCASAEVQIIDCKAIAPGGKSLSFAELASERLCEEGTFINSKSTYAYGAAAAHVSVDPRTGQVVLVDYLAVEDVGRMINPKTCHGQVIGSIAQGLGSTFFEHLIYDEQGQLLNASLAEYLIPTADDFPNIRGVAMDLHPSPINPLGAKGGGEGGIIAVGGVIANAVASALFSFGVQPRELPLSPPRIWQLIEDSRSSGR